MKRKLAFWLGVVLLCVLLPTMVTPANAVTFSGNCGGEGDGSNLTWTMDKDTGILTIAGSGKMCDYTSDTQAPWNDLSEFIRTVIISEGTSSIGSYAFYNCSALTSVTIGNSVTSIGDSAFYQCSGLTSVTIGSSVTSIGDSAFYKCSGLTSVTIPDSVTSIGDSAFYYCSGLTSVTIGNSVTSIGNDAFFYCYRLKEITIPDSVTSIGNQAFWCCSGLTSVTIGNSVTSIGHSAFYKCAKLSKVSISDLTAWCNISFGGIYSNPTYYAHALYLNGELIEDLVIPENISNINAYTFCGCTSLSSVTIPDSVTSIGFSAFYQCNNLSKVSISDLSAWCSIIFGDESSNPTYCAQALYLNGELIKDLVIPENISSINAYTFCGCTSLSSVTIPDSVTSIGDSAFYLCYWLTEITIPGSVTSIGDSVFYDCDGLTAITIPDSVTSIGNSAFYECSGLTAITIPDSVTSIGNSAFYHCYRLTAITIPDSVTSIGGSSFENCSGLTSVTIGNSVTSIGDSAFKNCNKLTAITIPDSVTSIGNYAFKYCSALTSVTIGNSVTSIGYSAFEDCNKLTAITIPDSVTSIGDSAFYKCSRLKSVTIGNSVTSIGSSTFYKCSGLTAITIPDSVTSIGFSAFYGCSAAIYIQNPNCEIKGDATTLGTVGETHICADLDGTVSAYAKKYGFAYGHKYLGGICIYCESSSCRSGVCGAQGDNLTWTLNMETGELVIEGSGAMDNGSAMWNGYETYFRTVSFPEGMTSIGEKAFMNCTDLTAVAIPESVTEIGAEAFSGCSKLTEITIPDSVTSIGYSAFYECYGLTSVTIGNSVTSIGDSAFYKCSGLTEITIPDSVTSIGNSAFYECSGLTSVTIGNSVTSIGNSAFYRCYGLTSVMIGNSVTSIGDSAFSYCIKLTEVTIPDSVKKLGKDAFQNCLDLRRLDLGSGIEDFKDTVFTGCDSLQYVRFNMPAVGGWFSSNQSVTTVEFGPNVKSISSPFENAMTLTEFRVDPANSNYCSVDGVLFSKDRKILIHYPQGKNGTYVIPVYVERIWSRAFRYCSGLTQISIPNTIHTIPMYAFYYCTGLTEVNLPNTTYTIEYGAFRGCNNLTSLKIYGQSCSVRTASTSNGSQYDKYTLGLPGTTVVYGYDGEYSGNLKSFAERYGYTFIPLEEHTHEYHTVQIEATCEVPGYTYSICDCGEYYGVETVPALGHACESWELISEPTCAENGKLQGYCTRCDYTVYQEIEALGHDWGDWTVTAAPTCTETGIETRSCMRCHAYQTREVEALGHEWKEPSYTWSADNTSVTATRICTVNPAHVETETTQTSSKISKPATQSEEGEMVYTAVFTNPAFEPQTRVVVLPKLAVENPFVDVKETDFFYDAVLWAVNHEPLITTGTSKTKFSPGKDCTREQVVTFLWRALSCPEPTNTQNPFKDVPADAYYTKAVLWAVENGITTGKSKTKFGVGDPCNRAQVVTFLWRAKYCPEPTITQNPFKDVPADAYYTKAVLWAVEKGITKGTSKTKFSPDQTCNRGQVVTFLYRDMVGVK